MTDLSKYWVETAGTHIQHYAVDKEDAEAKSLGNVSTYYYPNASSTVTYVLFSIHKPLIIPQALSSLTEIK